MGATQSFLLYAAEVWADALDKEVRHIRLGQVQRRGALRVASAYRTFSEPAVMVIAGVVPITLLAEERKATYRRKGEKLREWQRFSQNDQRGRWTAQLINYLDP